MNGDVDIEAGAERFASMGASPAPMTASERASWAIAVAAAAETQVNRVMAQQLAAIADTIAEARAHPFVFDGLGSGAGREAVEFAVLAAVAELATELHVSEGTIRVRALHAETLRGRMPLLWHRLCAGETSYQHVRVVLDAAVGLADDAAAWSAYDEALAGSAARVTPGALRP